MAAKRKVDLSVVLADAETFGDVAAAKTWKVSERSIRRYRVKAANCPELSGLTEAKRRELAGDWMEAAKAARQEVLARGLELSRSCDQLRDVAGFLKILNDAVSQDEALVRIGGRNQPSTGPEGHGQQAGQAQPAGVIPIRRATAAE